MTERYFRRLTSIPPRTSLDVLRGRVAIRLGGGSLPGGVRRRVSQGPPRAGESDWSKVEDKHLYKKEPGQEKARHQPPYEGDDKIGWRAEIVDNYDNKGNLGILLEFAGIKELAKVSFLRGRRYYGPDTTYFYAQISYRYKRALLMLATIGDILESQVVPNRKDVNPFFQEELHLPQLAPTYNPVSMAVRQHNGLVIVSYNRK